MDFIGLSAHADSGTRTTKERRAARLSPRLRHPGNRGPSRPRVTRIQRVHLALRAAGAEPCRWPSPSPSRLPPRPCVTVTVLPRTATDAIARTEEARSIGRRIRRPGHGTNAPPISTLNRRFVDADRQQRQHAHRVPAARSGPPSPQTPASPFPSLPPASPGPPGASSSGLERGPVPSGRSSGRLHPPPSPPRGQRRPAAATTFCGRGRVPVMSGAILGTRPPAPSSAVGRRGTPQVTESPIIRPKESQAEGTPARLLEELYKIAVAARPNASSGTSARPAVEAHRNRAGQGPLRPSLALPGRARPLSARVRRRPAHAGQRAVDRKKASCLPSPPSSRRAAVEPATVAPSVLPRSPSTCSGSRDGTSSSSAQILDLQRRLADERLTPGGHKAPGGKGRRGSGIVGICDREATQSRRDSAGRSSSWP